MNKIPPQKIKNKSLKLSKVFKFFVGTLCCAGIAAPIITTSTISNSNREVGNKNASDVGGPAFTILGNTTPSGTAGVAGTEQYTTDITISKPKWSLENVTNSQDQNIRIGKENGLLEWDANALSCVFEVWCEDTDNFLSSSLDVTLTITGASLAITGPDAISGTAGTSGSEQYSSNAYKPSWTLDAVSPDQGQNLIIGLNTGILQWTATATSCSFTIKVKADNGDEGSLAVELTLNAKASPVTINGLSSLSGTTGVAGESTYTSNATNPKWSVSNVTNSQDSHINIGVSDGKLQWDSTTSNCKFTINCKDDGGTLDEGSLNVILNISTPTAPAIVITGPSTINDTTGAGGTEQYTATGTNKPVWQLIEVSDGGKGGKVSIDERSGLLQWTAATSSCDFKIICEDDDGYASTAEYHVDLTIASSSTGWIVVNGASVIGSMGGAGGYSQFTATDNLGKELNKAKWILDNLDPNETNNILIGNDGKLTWNKKASTCAFDVVCVDDEGVLSLGSMEVQLNITNATDIVVFGSPILQGVEGYPGASKYTAKDNFGNGISNPTWKITNAQPDQGTNVSIDQTTGLLSWNGDATDCTITIQCSNSTLDPGEIQVNLRMTKSSSIVVGGSNVLEGVSGYAGKSQYTATDNLGHSISNPTWTISGQQPDQGTNVSIDQTTGLLSWNESAKSGLFRVKCTSGTLVGEMTVNLNIVYTNTETKIVVKGATIISGVGGYAGTSQYTATSNLGIDIINPKWKISNLPAGVSGISIDEATGLLSYSEQASNCTFTITCSGQGFGMGNDLTEGTIQVALNVISPTNKGGWTWKDTVLCVVGGIGLLLLASVIYVTIKLLTKNKGAHKSNKKRKSK